MGYNPQESLETTINTMGTLLGVHPIVPWLQFFFHLASCNFYSLGIQSPSENGNGTQMTYAFRLGDWEFDWNPRDCCFLKEMRTHFCHGVLVDPQNLPSLKQTYALKMDGWKSTFFSFLKTHFQTLYKFYRQCTLSTIGWKNPRLPSVDQSRSNAMLGYPFSPFTVPHGGWWRIFKFLGPWKKLGMGPKKQILIWWFVIKTILSNDLFGVSTWGL